MMAVKKIGKTNDVIGEEIGKSGMVFTQIKKQRNLVGFETLALMRKRYKINVNAIIDGDSSHLFDEYYFDEIIAELEREKKEKEELRKDKEDLRKELDFFKKIAMTQKENFKQVYMGNLLDNLDPILAIDLLTRTQFLGRSFTKDLAGNC